MDNAGFMVWGRNQANIKAFFDKNKTLRVFGEWLVPHNFKGYVESAWRNFYVFDVLDDAGNYLHYETYKPLLDEFGILSIPPLAVIDNPTSEQLDDLVKQNKFMVEDQETHGEGIVVKRYDYVNQYGRVTWGKIVSNDFKEIRGTSKSGKVNIQQGFVLEEGIAKKYVTEALVEKEFAKIVNESDGWASKYIPRLLSTIFYVLVKEETYNFVKENKNPTINFKLLQTFVNARIKEVKPELF